MLFFYALLLLPSVSLFFSQQDVENLLLSRSAKPETLSGNCSPRLGLFIALYVTSEVPSTTSTNTWSLFQKNPENTPANSHKSNSRIPSIRLFQKVWVRKQKRS